MLPGDSVKTVRGIGEERLKRLNKMNIYTIKDLLMFFPRDYLDRSRINEVSEVDIDAFNTIKAVVAADAIVTRTKEISITKLTVKDRTGIVELIWYNQPYLKNYFKKNKEYLFTGKAVEKYNKVQMVSPEYEPYDETKILSGGRIVPVYVSGENLPQKLIRQIIYDAIQGITETLGDYLPERVLSEQGLCSRDYALRNIHFPENDKKFFIARKRLVFDELFMTQLSLLKVKGYVRKESEVNIKNTSVDDLIGKLPFPLTNAQKSVLEDIKNDMSGGMVMNRLVQGDVGSGKTVVALLAALIVVQNGYQVALMVPTEVLARQHYIYFNENFNSLGIETTLLTGSVKQREKNKIKERIHSRDIKMVIGTHAVITENVKFGNLGLVITDEQHRFGVRQRQNLSEKGDSPHVLVMTATPIPRTLALILYGDLDISCIDELPPGRQKIDTFCVNSSYHERLYAFIKKETGKGRQVYIICPSIEESKKKSVLDYTEKLKNEIFPEINVCCLHGKMKPDEKQNIMKRFSDNEIQILVSTTVIEVGINVPNATVMIIENAEQFGLSQLHQLRGRIGRGIEKSYCVLITDAKSKVTKERMNIICKSSDGFEISEKDLELRGYGEFFGTRQHGLPEMRIANLYKDMNVLQAAQQTALSLYQEKGEFSETEIKNIEEEAANYFRLPENEIIL